MKIAVIASGSNGNSYLIQNKDTNILIDAGISGKQISERLKRMNLDLENLDGVLLTHGHSDHYKSVGIIARRYKTPIYATKESYEDCKNSIGSCEVKYFDKSRSFKIKDTEIRPIETSHDVNSCGFAINKFGLFTDTGIITKQMQDIIPKLKGVVLESNHDIDMLLNGSYPIFLKQRILSDKGHLSNVHASNFINENAKHLDWVLLGHLSGNNTTPGLTKRTFETIVKKKMDFNVLSRDKESGVWEI